ncbi:MAG: hypothetical protein M0002_03745 [Rhodospirillales bacterium]|nr:hypothetical protein [Rhodospirillales bacterium]
MNISSAMARSMSGGCVTLTELVSSPGKTAEATRRVSDSAPIQTA